MLDSNLEKEIDSLYKASQALSNEELKEKYEQFYSPKSIAEYMNELIYESKKNKIYFLDAGAGSGNLSIAFIKSILKWKKNLSR